MQVDFSKIKFDEKGLIPAIIQDAATNAVLMLAYMNGGGVLSKPLMFCVSDCCPFRIPVSGAAPVRFGSALISMAALACAA